MGACPENVHWVGSLGADNIGKEVFLSLDELEVFLGKKLGDKYIVATFHPATAQPGEEAKQTEALLAALDTKIAEGWKVLFTMPNSDTGGQTVAGIIREWADRRPNSVIAVASLGRRRFYAAMHHAAAIVGNSSSGLIEAPSFGIPTLNIGDRQKGRAQGNSVVNVPPEKDAIIKGLDKVLSDDFRSFSRTASNPYSKAGTLTSIVDLLLTHCLSVDS